MDDVCATEYHENAMETDNCGGDLSKEKDRFEKRKGKEVVNEDLEDFMRVR